MHQMKGKSSPGKADAVSCNIRAATATLKNTSFQPVIVNLKKFLCRSCVENLLLMWFGLVRLQAFIAGGNGLR